jgi:DNA-binding transcriptional MerR regulator
MPNPKLISIGQAARRLGVKPSALRYYDERGLVRPAARERGRRMYGADELRRLGFIVLLQRLNIGLGVAGTVLDAPTKVWRDRVTSQITELDARIAEVRAARDFLAHALDCPAPHPTRQCPVMLDVLDRIAQGVPIAQIAADHEAKFHVNPSAAPPRHASKRRPPDRTRR